MARKNRVVTIRRRMRLFRRLNDRSAGGRWNADPIAAIGERDEAAQEHDRRAAPDERYQGMEIDAHGAAIAGLIAHDDIEIAGEGFVKADFSGGDASRLEETLLGCERRLFIVAAHDAETAGFAGIVGSGDRTLAEVLYAIARNRGLVAGLHDENALFPPGGQGDNADDGDAE